MSDVSSKQLLAQYRDGDEKAAEQIFSRYVNRLVSLARQRLSRKLARKLDPEDVVQSAYRSFFVRARAGQYELKEGGDMWRLLAAITINKLLKKVEYYQAVKRDIDLEHSVAPESQVSPIPVEEISREPNQDEVAGIIEEIGFVMRELIPSHREILALHLQGYSVKEIAETLSRSQTTVRRCLHKRAIPMLRTRLELSSA